MVRAIERASSWLSAHETAARCDTREIRGLVDAVARALPSSSVDSRAAICDRALAELDTLSPGDGAAACVAVAEGRWGAAAADDGVSLARVIRPERPADQLSTA